MVNKIRKIPGANMDIDFSPANWKQGKCPWSPKHKCAVKNISTCDYFEGIEKDDKVLCSYPQENNSSK
jgi:hypothetical protein